MLNLQIFAETMLNAEFNYTDQCAFAEMALQEMPKVLALKVSYIPDQV